MTTRVSGRWVKAAFSWAVLALSLGLIGCGDDEPAGGSCSTAADCGQGQVCTGGQCVDAGGSTCRNNSDCTGTETCVSNVCVGGETDTGTTSDTGSADVGVTDTGSVLDTGVPVDTGVPDTTVVVDMMTEPDLPSGAPMVVSTTPENLATGVTVAADIIVRFNQHMDETTLIDSNIDVQSWDDQTELRRAINYNAEAVESVLVLSPAPDAQPSAPNFELATPYTVTLDAFIRGGGGLNLGTAYSFSFVTEGLTVPTEYATLARAYAPVIHQEIQAGSDTSRAHRMDWFTAFDYDDDLVGDNNRQGALSPDQALNPTVYYNVSETESHYLIQYVLYYPVAVDEWTTTLAQSVDHDFVYSLVVVKKVDDDALGSFVVGAGHGADKTFVFLCSGGADCADASNASFISYFDFDASDGTNGLEAPGGGDDVKRRIHWRITSGLHASCYWNEVAGSALGGDPCQSNSNPAAPDLGTSDCTDLGDNALCGWSRVLRAGDSATAWTSGSTAEQELAYELKPFVNTFWLTRGYDSIWGSSSVHTPDSGEGQAGTNTRYPTQISRENPGWSNDPVRAHPFSAEPSEGPTADGPVWFLDPAYYANGLSWNWSEGTYTRAYCFNYFLRLDRNEAEDCQ